MAHVLDNPVYAALSGPQAGFAEIGGAARRYPAAVAPFMGLASYDEAAWRAAAGLAGPGGRAAVASADAQSPAGWEVLRAFDVVQMVGTDAIGAAHPRALELGQADVPEMLELTRATNPGPFEPRTIELGRYLGIRDGDALVAMGGERMHADGWIEISAVCTAESHRGRGLAAALVRALVAGIDGRGARPFLHAMVGGAAIPLYERLGFEVRVPMVVSVLSPVGVR